MHVRLRADAGREGFNADTRSISRDRHQGQLALQLSGHQEHRVGLTAKNELLAAAQHTILDAAGRQARLQ
ncbi:hypothetical protein D9M69_668180 [compost metagenome]